MSGFLKLKQITPVGYVERASVPSEPDSVKITASPPSNPDDTLSTRKSKSDLPPQERIKGELYPVRI